MFDKKMICEEGFENVVENGKVVGFALLARLPYYRGLGLSMVEDVGVTVDGEHIPPENIRLELRGRRWSLKGMEAEYGARWNFGEKARVIALKDGGLKPGAHKIDLSERMRVSYLPFVPTTKDSKTLELRGWTRTLNMIVSPCIEWLFADKTDNLGQRVRAVKAAGYNAVEFHLWRDKPLDDVSSALSDTGVKVTSFCVDPRRSLVDPSHHEEFLQAVRDTIEAGKAIGSPPMIVASGFEVEGLTRAQQHANAVAVLRRAADLAEQAGVILLLEPLNSRVEHPGMFLVSTPEGLDIVEEVGSPNLRLLYDIYHSAVMGESMADVLRGRIHLVHHVQVADMAGRNEPGTGVIEWDAVMATLAALGYKGAVGLEYRPTMPSKQSIAAATKRMGLA